MRRVRLRHVLWALIVGTGIAGAFLVKDGIYTKMSRDIAGGITMPGFTLPIAAAVVIWILERLLRHRYPDIVTNAVLGLLWVVVVALIVGNMQS